MAGPGGGSRNGDEDFMKEREDERDDDRNERPRGDGETSHKGLEADGSGGAPRDEDRPEREGDGPSSDGGDDGECEILEFSATDAAGVPLEGEELPDALEVELADDPQAGELRVELDEARAELAEFERRLRDLEAENASLHDRVLRAAADFDNYRKRIERERREERRQAAASLVLRLLPVTDNFQRALDQAAGAGSGEDVLAGFVEGVQLIQDQLFDILRGAGLEEISTDGPFDPSVHEAMLQESRTDAPHMAILEVFERGYTFGGKLLRPARVKVATNPAGSPTGGDEGPDGEEPGPEGGAEPEPTAVDPD